MQATKDDDRMVEIFHLQAEFCKSLADPKRLMIIHELRNGAKSVAELADILGLKQSNTSQHLAVLRKAGVVVSQRQVNAMYYSLTNPNIITACDMVREVIAGQLERSQTLMEVI